MYRVAVAHAWEIVAEHLSDEDWARVAKVRVHVNDNNDRPYDFFAISGIDGQEPSIQLGIGGLRTAHFICQAMAIHEEMLGSRDPAFFGLYSIYLARARSIETCLPPWVMLGWEKEDVPDEVAELAMDRFIDCLYFILAHEVAHVLMEHPSCSSFESDPQQLARSRYRESEADQFAFDLLYKMGRTPLPILQIFLAWATGIEGTEEQPGRATHPAQLRRLAAAIDYAVALTEVRKAPAGVKAEMAALRMGMYKSMLAWEEPALREDMRKNIAQFRESSLRRPRPTPARR